MKLSEEDKRQLSSALTISALFTPIATDCAYGTAVGAT
jgi:hypothetical protein